jgi:hypothetical protein
MIYDIKTNNRSFLKVSLDLRKRGVKNNKFMLALHNPELSGVDPHDPDITSEQKVAIFKECAINKWYYLREVVRVPVDGVISGISYQLNLGNLTLSYLKSKNINQIMILPRQHGKTVGAIIDDTWTFLFAGTNANIIYSNKEFKDSKKNLKLFKDIRDRLPRWIMEFVSNSKSDKDNEEYKLIANRNNTLKAMAAANSDDQADKLGRGMTTSNIYFDEFAFLTRNKLIFEAALPAWSVASENAKKNGIPYGITITTTPNNVDIEQGSYCKMMIDKAAKFNVSCFDMNDEEFIQFIKDNSSNDFVFAQYDYKDLGRDDAWLTQQIRYFQGDIAKVKRELLLEWPRSTDSSLFTEEQLDKIFQFVKKPMASLKVDNYFIEFYEQPDFNTNYIISCDVAGGLSQDNSAISIIAPDDFRIVGDFKNNKIDTEHMKRLIESLVKNYFKNAILIVERNSYGLNIIQYFMGDRDVERRMVREERDAIGEKTQKDGFNVKRRTRNIVYGVDTNMKSRRLMMELLPEIIDNEYDKLCSPKLYDDIAGMERKKTGKIEHSDSSHDDILFSYLIFRYALHYGDSLRQKFGISPVPSKSNLKAIGTNSNITKIGSIIENANKFDNLLFNDHPAYQTLMRQEQNNKEESDMKDAFLRILDMND